MVAKYSEMFATTILLILLAVFILHLIRGDAMEWLGSKFKAHDPNESHKQTTDLGAVSGVKK